MAAAGAKLGYPLGFLTVVLGRRQLLTENTLTVIIGTTIGGVSLLAALNHAQVVQDSGSEFSAIVREPGEWRNWHPR